MFEKNDKRRLYWLIDQYLLRQIDGWTFSNEYYYSYNLEISDRDLTELEKIAFSELEKITSRYTNIQEDLIKYPNVYYSEKELEKKIIETKKKLENNENIKRK